ncbi:sulfurtransferase-like selenium metabolism protein YedF [Clostridium sp. 'deep sea']|uniref:sulfurtransferase-like selenium metabolism protein YedF n=1 Tax=Clostridium sp. 'deep sea' TaxID=2779445 RepID=UPI0018965AEC|nr:sulfurtransferase-like selenium metabolism protein YedF [Clostridium sp. 'deep sea']QOR35572.1 sulfurtransferase-like selenium metabolism protein YedF [Clostridium sp. 'deep sea']
MNSIDCRGLNCPQPVIKTKKAIDELSNGSIIVVVDSEVAKNNVLKLTKKLQCSAKVENKNGEFHISITKGKASAPLQQVIANPKTVDNGTVVFCMSDVFGVGDDKLGKVLMKAFFYSLTQLETAPKAIVLMNRGINLALKESAVIESLQELDKKGVEILSCGTCLDFYHQKENLAVGEITNMYTATEVLNEAGKIIRI